MKGRISFKDREYSVDLSNSIDISHPVKDGLDNPNCYYSDPVNFEVIKKGDFIGSVELGGTVNHKKIHLTPHGNGTHTECYGHISSDNATIYRCLTEFHFLAELISIKPEMIENGDRVISLDNFNKNFSHVDLDRVSAIVIRTLPNDQGKRQRSYSGTNPPYFDPQLMHFLVENNIKHLLVDLPSVDREEDGGKLLCHKAFWGFPDNIRKNSTITELIYVPDKVSDGIYLLNIQIASLELDVSPSKPVLFKIDN